MSDSIADFINSDAFWRQAAEFSAQSRSELGPGAVVIHEQDLRVESANRIHLGVSYLTLDQASPLWNEETRTMARECDPAREFMVISVQADGQALSLTMEFDPGSPPAL